MKQGQIDRRDLLKGLLSTGAWLLGSTAIFAPRLAHAETQSILLDVYEVDGRPTYNGRSPGRTIIADPGDTIDVTLLNNLPPLHDDCTLDPNAFHGRNTTNLHTHGLHVSPGTDSSGAFDADNVFLSVVPEGQIVPCEDVCGEDVGTTFRWHRADYRFELGQDHPSGTFWYHAHKHGATLQQVGAGLAGPLIVRDRPGDMPDYIEQAQETVLMIMNQGLVQALPEGGGIVNPTLTLAPGSVHRWRIINAQAAGNSFAYFTTDVPALEIYQIAFDGLTLPRRVALDQYDNSEPWMNPAALAPGNRMDLIVRVPEDARARRFEVGVATGLSDLLSFGNNTAATKLNIEIAGAPVTAPWSDDPGLPGPGLTPFDDTELPKRAVNFTPGFTVDRAAYDGAVAHQMRLGTSEEWTVNNATGGVHAYHIHVNPLFITHINGIRLDVDDPRRRWQDTIGLPYGTGGGGGDLGSVTYKTRFERFTGRFVIHCHILRHEDLGMMQAVEIIE